MSSGWWLFARARHSLRTVVAITALTCVELLVGSSSHQINGENQTLLIPWVVVLPVVAATFIGVGTRSAVSDLEGTSTRSLAGLRAVHLTVVLGAAVLATAIGSAELVADPGSELSGTAAVRNLITFAGLSLISVALLGSSLAWPLPLTLAIAATTVGSSSGVPHWWALPIRPDSDVLAAVIAAAVLTGGFTLVIAGGTREPPAERD